MRHLLEIHGLVKGQALSAGVSADMTSQLKVPFFYPASCEDSSNKLFPPVQGHKKCGLSAPDRSCFICLRSSKPSILSYSKNKLPSQEPVDFLTVQYLALMNNSGGLSFSEMGLL